ncbi:hypothetical protein EBZ80_08835 [bacterium]|nr:hypothetical protein [bacterium]
MIPKTMAPRPERLIGNAYQLLKEPVDDFHAVVYFVGERRCRVVVRRLDAFTGWGQFLRLRIDDEVLDIGASETNEKTMELETRVALSVSVIRDQKIPRVIIQTFSTRQPQHPLHYNAFLTFVELNPEYEYRFFDDADCRSFIRRHFPERVLEAYDILKARAFRADLFRYCYLVVHGGCYFDHKYVLRRRLQDLVRPDDDHVLCQDLAPWGLFNSVMLAIPGSDAIRRCLDQAVDQIHARFYGQNALQVTGPDLLWRHANHLNTPLRHVHGRQILFEDRPFISTTFPGYYGGTRHECYGHLWDTKRIYHTQRVRADGYVFLVEPHTDYIMNKELADAVAQKSRLRRVRERNAVRSMEHRLHPARFEFRVADGAVRIERIDRPGHGWDLDLRLSIIHEETSKTCFLHIGTSPEPSVARALP